MSKRVYGIDLGTTYSCIAYVDEHGKPIVVPNSESQPTTPSVVYFESSDNVVVGSGAKEQAMIHHDRVVSTIKRSMGDANYEKEVDGKIYKPQDISSFILRRLVKDAAAQTGDTIEDVVITCPAYFGVNQKEATKEAGTIAGLNVLYVIPEPTAAAIAYGMDQEKEQNILVYDLGGGTFDITLIAISPSEIRVIATGGDDQLGGKDWDDDLVGFLARAFEAETGTPSHQLLEDQETYQQLLNDAEKIKIRLSQAKAIEHKVRYQAGDVKVKLTREKFDELTLPRLERTVSLTEEMLKRAESYGVTQIDKLLLVGGSTYMPQVVERMKRFPFPVVQYDPNQAVAKGAALFGFREELVEKIKERVAKGERQERAQQAVALEHGLPGKVLKSLTDRKISNVSSKSFGLIVIDKSGKEVVQNLVVIDQQVPLEVTRRFGTHSTGQTDAELRVMQNQQRTGPNDTVDLSLCDLDPVGTAELSFNGPLPQGSPIEITFKLAADGCLSLQGRDLTTGREVKAEFKTKALRTKEEIAEVQSRALAMDVSG